MTDEPQWQVLDLPSGVVVEHIAGASPGYVVVGGSREGAAFAAEVQGPPRNPEYGDPLIPIPVPEQAAAAGPVRAVRVTEAGVLGVCGPTTVWGRRRPEEGAYSNEGWVEYVASPTQVYELPRHDETGADPVWVWVTSGDGDLQATAAYPTTDGRHEVRPLDMETFALMERDRPLVTTAPLDDLHVAASAGRITVAGPITDPVNHPGTDPGLLTSWWASSVPRDPEEYRYRPPWDHNPFSDPPARLLGSSDGESFYLGLTDDGLVALWDADGELRESTGLRVDLEDPVAVIAELDVWGAYEEEGDEQGGLAAYAVATPEGNVLACRGLTFSMPDGRLRAAVVNRGFDLLRCFALIDTVVYVLAFDYPPERPLLDRLAEYGALTPELLTELASAFRAMPGTGTAAGDEAETAPSRDQAP